MGLGSCAYGWIVRVEMGRLAQVRGLDFQGSFGCMSSLTEIITNRVGDSIDSHRKGYPVIAAAHIKSNMIIRLRCATVGAQPSPNRSF